jgi:uncharacterized protein (TIGR03067 family)
VSGRLKKLIEELDSDSFETRERATAQLEKYGGGITGTLNKLLDGEVSAEIRKRVKMLLGKLKNAEKAKEVESVELQGTRAVEILEQLGTPEAIKLLREWASTKLDTELTRQARDAVKRHEATANTSPDVKGGNDSLEGTWEATAVTRNGKDASADEVQKHTMTIKGDQLHYQMFRTIIKGKIQLDSGKTPKEIDLVHEHDGASRKWIYELKGDTLRFCFKTREADRPTEFTGKMGFLLVVFKKVK